MEKGGAVGSQERSLAISWLEPGASIPPPAGMWQSRAAPSPLHPAPLLPIKLITGDASQAPRPTGLPAE